MSSIWMTFTDYITENGPPSSQMLSLLQEQAVSQVALQPWCPRSQGWCLPLAPQPIVTTSRFAFLIWDASAPRSMSSLFAVILSPMSTSSYLLKPSKPRVSAPTSTSPRLAARTPSTCVSVSTPSMLSESTRCCPAQGLIVCKPECVALGGSHTAPSPVLTLARSSFPSEPKIATLPSSSRLSVVRATSSPVARRSSFLRNGVSLVSARRSMVH